MAVEALHQAVGVSAEEHDERSQLRSIPGPPKCPKEWSFRYRTRRLTRSQVAILSNPVK